MTQHTVMVKLEKTDKATLKQIAIDKNVTMTDLVKATLRELLIENNLKTF